jgi:two-component system phosphate regulon response regulator PhoB
VLAVVGPRVESVTLDVSAGIAASATMDGMVQVVDRAGRPVGGVSHDALAAAAADAHVVDLMEPARGVLREDDPIERAARRMVESDATWMPVVTRAGGLMGAVSSLDLMGALLRQAPATQTPRPTGARSTHGAQVVVLSGDGALVDGLAERLAELGLRLERAVSAAACLVQIRRCEPRVVVIDAALPNMPFTELVRRIRNTPGGEDSGLLVIADRSDEMDRVVAFELGVDEHLVTRPGPRELALRVRALARRVGGALEPAPPASAVGSGADTRLVWRGLELDRLRQDAVADGRPLSLRRMEFRLLSLLMERRGRVLSRGAIGAALWDPVEDVSPRTVDTHVRRLRAALGAYSDAIETVHGAGYRLRMP